MASYSVAIRRSAEAEFLAVPFPFRRQINERIFKLKTDPRPEDSQLLEGTTYRLRVSGWGVLYEVDDDRSSVIIISVKPPPR